MCENPNRPFSVMPVTQAQPSPYSQSAGADKGQAAVSDYGPVGQKSQAKPEIGKLKPIHPRR